MQSARAAAYVHVCGTLWRLPELCPDAGALCRYRSKYVTCVMYKPRKRHQLSDSEPMESSPRVR